MTDKRTIAVNLPFYGAFYVHFIFLCLNAFYVVYLILRAAIWRNKRR